jgi:hypothetical protein
MQLRLNDVTVNDVPPFLTDKPTPLTHTHVIPTDDFVDPYVIPMSLHGVASSFPTRKPTIEEYKSLPHLVLTSEEPAYDPHDDLMARHKEALAKAVLETGDRVGAMPPRCLCLVSKTLLTASGSDGVQVALKQISTIHDDAAFCNTMRANISTVCSASAGPQLTPRVLATNWGINARTATRTVRATTQRGIRTVLHPTPSHRFRTNDRQLRYRRLPIYCFTDTLDICNTGWLVQGVSHGREIASP